MKNFWTDIAAEIDSWKISSRQVEAVQHVTALFPSETKDGMSNGELELDFCNFTFNNAIGMMQMIIDSNTAPHGDLGFLQILQTDFDASTTVYKISLDWLTRVQTQEQAMAPFKNLREAALNSYTTARQAYDFYIVKEPVLELSDEEWIKNQC